MTRYLAPDEWTRHLESLSREARDVYFTPDYLALGELMGDGEPECFAYTRGEHTLLVPGMRLAIDGVTGAFDLQTPNGYGGPLASNDVTAEFLEEAWGAWRDASKARGVVAAFFRLHALLANRRWLPTGARVLRDRTTRYLDVRGEGAPFRDRNRIVNAGRRAGTEVRWNAANDWSDFEVLYGEAMNRLDAPTRLRFSRDYFARLQALPGAALAALRDDQGLIGGNVYLFGPVWGHYHLSARRNEVPNYAISLLMVAGMDRTAELGLRGLYLGGGATASPDDGVLRFKTQFGGEALDFEVALVIADEARYQALVADWTRKEGRPPAWLLGYRQPRGAEPETGHVETTEG